MLLLLTACDSLTPTWIDQIPACNEEPYDWSDDLITFVKSGPGDGSFDMDPPGEAAVSVSGKYGTAEGDFVYTIEYGEDYWLASEEVTDGVGTAWHNGDLDVEYITTTTDKLDVTTTVATREQREGCNEDWWTWDPDADEPTYQAFSGKYDDGMFTWEADDDSESWTGTLAPDSTSTVTIETDKDLDEYVFAPDGTSHREFDLDDGTYTYVGDQDVAWNGDVSQSYKQRKDGDTVCTIDAEYDYDGDGTAHYDCGSDEYDCDFSVKDSGVCTYSCTNGDKGSC